MCVYVCRCVYVCICVCMCACVFIWVWASVSIICITCMHIYIYILYIHGTCIRREEEKYVYIYTLYMCILDERKHYWRVDPRYTFTCRRKFEIRNTLRQMSN